MPTRNVNLTDELDQSVLHAVESGRYENASEVVRAALRDFFEDEAKIAAVREAILAGKRSGIAEGWSLNGLLDRLHLPQPR